MTVALSTFGEGQLPAGSAAILMAPLTAAGQVTSVLFTNTKNAVETITVYLVRSGGAPGPGNIRIDALPLAPGMAYVSPELRGRNMGVGDALYGFATDGSAVNFVIDGLTVA